MVGNDKFSVVWFWPGHRSDVRGLLDFPQPSSTQRKSTTPTPRRSEGYPEPSISSSVRKRPTIQRTMDFFRATLASIFGDTSGSSAPGQTVTQARSTASRQPIPEGPTFTNFSSLPIELRLKIWRQNCKPRLITVKLIPFQGIPRLFSFHGEKLVVLSQVNRESRAELWRYYNYRDSFQGNVWQAKAKPMIFSFDYDTLLFADLPTFNCFFENHQRGKTAEQVYCFEHLGNLAIANAGDMHSNESKNYLHSVQLRKFLELKHLIFIVGQRRSGESGIPGCWYSTITIEENGFVKRGLSEAAQKRAQPGFEAPRVEDYYLVLEDFQKGYPWPLVFGSIESQA